jgi:hypothetical protein
LLGPVDQKQIRNDGKLTLSGDNTMGDKESARKARLAISTFQIMSSAFLLRGYYRLSGKTGQTLENALRNLDPEIYGSMNDSRITELKGLEYVLDRLPKGIEQCNRIVMMAHEDLKGTSFEEIIPPKRRRLSYRVGDNEMSMVVSRGSSEVYDILTHLTFLYIEAKKIYRSVRDEEENLSREWKRLEDHVNRDDELAGAELDKALWDLSIILGRTFQETKETYAYMQKSKEATNSSNGIFHIIYNLGRLIEREKDNGELVEVRFTPSLIGVIMNQIYGKRWAAAVKEKLTKQGLLDRPLHIISANLHSVLNLLYGYETFKGELGKKDKHDIYKSVQQFSDRADEVKKVAQKSGFQELRDESGFQINCQIIDTAGLDSVEIHPAVHISKQIINAEKPVLLVVDYAFGTQAFEAMDELLKPWQLAGSERKLHVQSISIMGKAGTLSGKKGDIMLATAHVLEGTPHNYSVDGDLTAKDFEADVNVFAGPIITVLGTSLQNRDVLDKFQKTSWNAVGLEMEGGHYQRAINAAMIRGHISKDAKLRYAYYASDNPLISGQTLAAGAMGEVGIRPTYMITKVFLEKILS